MIELSSQTAKHRGSPYYDNKSYPTKILLILKSNQCALQRQSNDQHASHLTPVPTPELNVPLSYMLDSTTAPSRSLWRNSSQYGLILHVLLALICSTFNVPHCSSVLALLSSFCVRSLCCLVMWWLLIVYFRVTPFVDITMVVVCYVVFVFLL